MFELTPYADVLEVMTKFEKRSPKKFLAMLRDKIKADAARIVSFERTKNNLTVNINKSTTPDDLLASNAKLIRIVKEIPPRACCSASRPGRMPTSRVWSG